MAQKILAEIDAEIKKTEKELQNVRGSETEVYARIVGYYRSVKNWNKGKRDEFDCRKMFVCKENTEVAKIEPKLQAIAATIPNKKNETANNEPAFYEFFMRKTCPNCPPVKNFMSDVNVEGVLIDVDSNDGLSQAAKKGVFAAPTVIVYDSDGEEIGRGHNVEELSLLLNANLIARAV